jgi:hypothetical protein
MQKAIICWIEQGQISKDESKRTAEACGAVRKAKTQNEFQLEQVTKEKEKTFHNTFETRTRQKEVQAPQLIRGETNNLRQRSLRFYMYLFLDYGEEKSISNKSLNTAANWGSEIVIKRKIKQLKLHSS